MSCEHTRDDNCQHCWEEALYQRFRERLMKELGIMLFDANWGKVRASFTATSPEPFQFDREFFARSWAGGSAGHLGGAGGLGSSGKPM